MQFWSLGWEDPLEEEMTTHSNILSWRIPWTEDPGRLQSIGWHRVRHDWSILACMHVNSPTCRCIFNVSYYSSILTPWFFIYIFNCRWSFPVGFGIFFFFIAGCSIISCNFGVPMREVSSGSFYSAILAISPFDGVFMIFFI